MSVRECSGHAAFLETLEEALQTGTVAFSSTRPWAVARSISLAHELVCWQGRMTEWLRPVSAHEKPALVTKLRSKRSRRQSCTQASMIRSIGKPPMSEGSQLAHVSATMNQATAARHSRWHDSRDPRELPSLPNISGDDTCLLYTSPSPRDS